MAARASCSALCARRRAPTRLPALWVLLPHAAFGIAAGRLVARAARAVHAAGDTNATLGLARHADAAFDALTFCGVRSRVYVDVCIS